MDMIIREGSIFDSFSKLKLIYDYQSSKCVDDDVKDGHLSVKNNGVRHYLPSTYGSDGNFDRVKMLYDRCKDSIQRDSHDSASRRCDNDAKPTT